MITTIIAMMLALVSNVNAQIVHEATYGNIPGPSFFTIIHLGNSGDKYAWVSPSEPKEVILYNLDNSQWKVINLSAFPGCYVSINYISDNLFSTDGKVYTLITAYNVTNVPYATAIVDEYGQMIFFEPNFSPQESSNSPAIFNTSDGPKMRLLIGDASGEVRIYGLPGVFTDIPKIGEVQNTGSINSFPNPATGSVTIKYALPTGANSGQILLYNSIGQELKSYKVDRNFADLNLSTADFPAGNYFWQLCAGNFKTTKKMIVVK